MKKRSTKQNLVAPKAGPAPPSGSSASLLPSPITMPDTVSHPALDKIDLSTTNPRSFSGFDDAEMRTLRESIKARGIIQPLIGRLGTGTSPRIELVAGERRFQCATELKLATVPMLIGKFTDMEAREIQALENFARSNLSEIEEAQGFTDMLAIKETNGQPRWTVETLALRLGTSDATVYARLKLMRLPPIGRKAMVTGKLNASTALLLARIPNPKQQAKALAAVLDPYGTGELADREKGCLNPEIEALSFRKTKGLLELHYMKRLKGAPFNQEDAALVPAYCVAGTTEPEGGGPCSTCPFRSGNLKRKFPDLDIESADVCTNTACFAKKKDASFRKDAAVAKEDGCKLLPASAGARLFNSGYNGNGTTGPAKLASSDYVELKGEFPVNGKVGRVSPSAPKLKRGATWEDALGEHVPEQVVQVRDPNNRVRFLLPVKEAIAAAEKAGLKVAPPPERGGYNAADEARKRAEMELKRKFSESVAELAMTQVLKALPKTVDLDLLQFLTIHICRDAKVTGKTTVTECLTALVQETFRQRVEWQSAEFLDPFAKLCRFFKVDLSALHKAEKAKAVAAVPPADKVAAAKN